MYRKWACCHFVWVLPNGWFLKARKITKKNALMQEWKMGCK